MSDPLVSVIICTYNRDHFLKECLRHLSQQKTGKYSFEILVIDNNSTDKTNEVCQEFANSHTIPFEYLKETRQGLSYCRNTGMTAARGAIITYLDDDAFPNEAYVLNIGEYFENHPYVDAIGGKIIPLYEESEPSWMSKYLLPLVAAIDLGSTPKPFPANRYPLGANMAFRSSVLRNLAGFDHRLGRKGEILESGEEKELFIRLKKAKGTIHYLPGAWVKHLIPPSRTTEEYIRKMAIGIGKSESVRVGRSTSGRTLKWLEELVKIAATIPLAAGYIFSFQWPKARMLLKFRLWLIKSFIKN